MFSRFTGGRGGAERSGRSDSSGRSISFSASSRERDQVSLAKERQIASLKAELERLHDKMTEPGRLHAVYPEYEALREEYARLKGFSSGIIYSLDVKFSVNGYSPFFPSRMFFSTEEAAETFARRAGLPEHSYTLHNRDIIGFSEDELRVVDLGTRANILSCVRS